MKMLKVETEFGAAFVPKRRLRAIVPEADPDTEEATGRYIVFVDGAGGDLTLLTDALPKAVG